MKDWDDDKEYDLDDEFEDEDFEDDEDFDDDDDLEAFLEASELEDNNLRFEVDFYSRIAGTTQFQVLSIPDEDGYVPTEKDIKILKTQVNMAGMDLLFRVAIGKHAVVFSPNSQLIGIMPQDNPHGFMC